MGGFRRDKKFLEKSLEAAMARNEDLEPLAQRLQVSHHSSCNIESVQRNHNQCYTEIDGVFYYYCIYQMHEIVAGM